MAEDSQPSSPGALRAKIARWAAFTSIGIGVLNFGVLLLWWESFGGRTSPTRSFFEVLAVLQAVSAAVAAFAGLGMLLGRAMSTEERTKGFAFTALSGLLGALAYLGIALAESCSKPIDVMGPPWGRPLRLRGRVLHPELRLGSRWTAGARPSPEPLDAPTRLALEQCWLHDAQKEHASVPAFARISWLLAAVGGPPELVEWSHRAALEEIDHARRCFALAAGYGGREHDVQPMPDLLLGGLDLRGDPLVHLATESLRDGCLLEDFNADVAGACAQACTEPSTRDVLDRIAREERSHAEFSWALLAWLVERGETRVQRALAAAAPALASVARPTAIAREVTRFTVDADHGMMRAHGRIDDSEWAALWAARVPDTQRRLAALLEVKTVNAA